MVNINDIESSVSDTAARDRSADRSGPTIREILSVRQNILVEENDSAIVSDDAETIQRVIRAWTGRVGDDKIDWIITTGGTGLGIRDITPEVRSSRGTFNQLHVLTLQARQSRL